MAKKKIKDENNEILDELKNVSMNFNDNTIDTNSDEINGSDDINEIVDKEVINDSDEINETDIKDFSLKNDSVNIESNEIADSNEQVVEDEHDYNISENTEVKAKEIEKKPIDLSNNKKNKRTKEYIHYNEMMGYIWNGQNF